MRYDIDRGESQVRFPEPAEFARNCARSRRKSGHSARATWRYNDAMILRASILLTGLLTLALAAASGEPPARIGAASPACGRNPNDWCPSPAGDPCGAHRNEASCRADAQCLGMPYRGESVVACVPDGKGFWSNCPAVGCISRSPRQDRD